MPSFVFKSYRVQIITAAEGIFFFYFSEKIWLENLLICHSVMSKFTLFAETCRLHHLEQIWQMIQIQTVYNL